MEKNYTELSRRIMTADSEGIACGPCSILAVTAEIVLDIDGEKKYLTGAWEGDTPSMMFEASDVELFKYYNDPQNNNVEELLAAREEESYIADEDFVKEYPEQAEELKKMMKEYLLKEELYNPYEDYEEDELEEMTAEELWGF